MFKFFGNWVLNAVSLFIISRILPGVIVNDFGVALFAVIVISLLNILVRPILLLFTLPINILTLGLFTFVINALVFMLASNFVVGFRVTDFFSGLLGSILFSIVSTLFQSLTRS